MNFKKIVSAVAAAAVAVSAMAISTFALGTDGYLKDGTLFINADKPEDPKWAADAGVAITDIYGVTFHVTFNADEVANESTWIGGGIGTNSPSTGWAQKEWGRNSKEYIADLENGTITMLLDAPAFKEDDAYAQFWLQTWGGTVTVNSADVLGKDGVLLSDAPAAPAEEEAPAEDEAAPAEDEAAAEEEAPAPEEEVADEAPAEEAPAEEEAAPEVTEAAPAADTTATAPAATGNVAAAAIVSVMAVAAAAAVAAKKRK